MDRKRLRIHSNIVGCFCFAENRGMLPSIELLVFLLIELDVIVINRRLWLKTFCLYCYFSVFGGITDKCDDLWLLAVWLFYCFVFEQLIMLVDFACHRYCCIVKIGFELYCLSKPVDVVFVGFEFIRWNLSALFA